MHRLACAVLVILTLLITVAGCNERATPSQVELYPASTIYIKSIHPATLKSLQKDVSRDTDLYEIVWAMQQSGLTPDMIDSGTFVHTGSTSIVYLWTKSTEEAWAFLQERAVRSDDNFSFPAVTIENPNKTFAMDPNEEWMAAVIAQKAIVIGGLSGIQDISSLVNGEEENLYLSREYLHPIMEAYPRNEDMVMQIMSEENIQFNERASKIAKLLGLGMPAGVLEKMSNIRAMAFTYNKVEQGCSTTVAMQFEDVSGAVFASTTLSVLGVTNSLFGGNGSGVNGAETSQIARNGTLVLYGISSSDTSLCAQPITTDTISSSSPTAQTTSQPGSSEHISICGTATITVSEGANLRLQPSTSSTVVAKLPHKSDVQLICGEPISAEGYTWVQVRRVELPISGWIARELINIDN